MTFLCFFVSDRKNGEALDGTPLDLKSKEVFLPVKYLIEIFVFDLKGYVMGRQRFIFEEIRQPVLF
jgi:hypothetical protein